MLFKWLLLLCSIYFYGVNAMHGYTTESLTAKCIFKTPYVPHVTQKLLTTEYPLIPIIPPTNLYPNQNAFAFEYPNKPIRSLPNINPMNANIAAQFLTVYGCYESIYKKLIDNYNSRLLCPASMLDAIKCLQKNVEARITYFETTAGYCLIKKEVALLKKKHDVLKKWLHNELLQVVTLPLYKHPGIAPNASDYFYELELKYSQIKLGILFIEPDDVALAHCYFNAWQIAQNATKNKLVILLNIMQTPFLSYSAFCQWIADSYGKGGYLLNYEIRPTLFNEVQLYKQ